MLVVAMKPTASQIQPQNLRDHAPPLSSTANPASSDQMLLASPPPLSPSKRPKLSLQTSSVPVAVGKSTTALSVSMNGLQSASPTVRNTFNNAYDIPLRPSPIGTSPSAKWPKPISSTITKREEQPYAIPHNIKGILRNPPYMSSLRRSALTATNSASPRSGRRIFFPPIKKVTYRTPLEEEIKTVKFIARHSDLSSEEDSEDDKHGENQDQKEKEGSVPPKRVDEDNVQISRPLRSPVLAHGKRKRSPREWRWTLGTLDDEGEEGEGEAAAAAAAAAAEAVIPIQKAARPTLSIDTEANVPSCGEDDSNEEKARKTPFPFDIDNGSSGSSLQAEDPP